MSMSDELNERLRKAREDARLSLEKAKEQKTGKTPQPEADTGFLPYATMFKLEERSEPQMSFDPTSRNVVCVNCDSPLAIDIYYSNPSLQSKCLGCGMTAGKYWKNKSHKKVG